MGKTKAEASTIRLSAEATFGTNPAAGYQICGVEPGGIQDWLAKNKYVERDPLSVYAAMEKGDIVGLDVEPKLVHDFIGDWIDLHAGPIFRAVTKHAGNKGQSAYRFTAVTATGYTVPANGDLAQNTVIYAYGSQTAANNGLHVVGSGSVGTETKTAGLVVDAAPNANALFEVAGWQASVAADIKMDANGNLTSTADDFTTMGLNVGQMIKIGGSTAGTQFATAVYNGFAYVKAIAAHLLTLEDRSWTVGSADAAAGKTVQLLFTRFDRNVPINHADYLEPSLHGELEEIGPGTANAATYTEAKGLGVKSFEINAPLENKIVTTVNYVGTQVPNPVLAGSRIAGPSTAYAPLKAALFDTASDLKSIRLFDATTGTSLVAEINTWKLTFESNVTARKVQATLGTFDLVYGKFTPKLTMEIYYTDYNVQIALNDNRDLRWDARMSNGQGGYAFRMPLVGLRGGPRTYPANGIVTLNCEVPGFRDPNTNVVCSMSTFAYLP
jgi:hypothetical protein